MIAAKALQDIDVLVEKVSSVTGLSTQEISSQLEDANVKAFRLNDVILISPDDFDSIIDSWADSIKVKLSIQSNGLVKPSAASPAPTASAPVNSKSSAQKSPARKIAPTKTALRKSTTAKSTLPKVASIASSKSPGKGLAWPKGFENDVSHLYTHTLKRILPEAAAERQPYLEAIANETSVGKKLADELVTAIVARSTRKLAFDKVMAGLIAKCASMLASS